MKQLAGLLIILVCFFSVAVAPVEGAGKNQELTFQRAKDAYSRLLTSTAPQRSHRDRWVAVIERLQGFSDLHPDHLRAAEAAYLVAQATEQVYRISRLSADARAAVESYDQLAKHYPESNFVADGLWRAALLSEAPLKDLSGAYRRYALLTESFPRSQPGADAKQKLKKLAAYAPVDQPAVTVAAGDHPLKAAKPGAARGKLNGVRAWSNPGYTRIVLDLSQPTEYTANLLRSDEMTGAPPRLYIDLPNTTPVGGLPETSVVNDGLLQQIRAGQPVSGRTRVVLDLRSLSAYKVFTLAEPDRIIIDITGSSVPASAELPLAGTATKTEPAAVKTTTAPVVAIAPLGVTTAITAGNPGVSRPSEGQKPKSVDPSPDKIAAILDGVPPEQKIQAHPPNAAPTAFRRIVLDAGHGGKDPGAIGPSGLLEKDVVLAMTLILAEEISTSLGWEVVLTRNDDTFIPLEERTAIANKAGADLFLSIHANASSNGSAHGIETYYLNFSKNEKAAAVAARENGTSLQQVGDLEQILFDLMAHSKIQESSRLASEIQNSLVESMGKQYSQIKDLGVKQGPFYVLLGANMPSVLVEAAFISNTTEETRLASSKYQKLVTKAILEGVRAYAGSLKVVAQK